ncbi:MAG: PRC-barrel domain-containing protein [Clostridium sp.]|nr:PRC-barrel domain-containing protein [Clostridium sp.]
MKKSREVVGLPVIDLTEGKGLGRVHSLIVNPNSRRVEAIEVGERMLLKTKTELLPFAKVRSIGPDAITLMKQEDLVDVQQQPELASLLEKKLLAGKVVTADGSLVGTVDDFSFNPADGNLAELFVNTEKTRVTLVLPLKVVENFGRDFIIVEEDYLAQSSEIEAIGSDRSGRQIVHSLEVKAIEFALDREAGQDVISEDGTAIIRKGEKVTNENIDLARRKNRLTQLLIAAGVGELLEGMDYTKEKLDAGSKKLLDSWQSLKGLSHEWLSRRLDDDRLSPTGELRELWQQLQSNLAKGSRELEDAVRQKMHRYVVGQTLSQPVYQPDGTLIGGRGDQVTEQMRGTAEAAGRLPQLFLSAMAGEVQVALEPIKKQLKDILNK